MRFDRTQSDRLSESKPKKKKIFPGHTVKAQMGSRGVVALGLDVGTSGVSGQLHTAVPIEEELGWAREPVATLRKREKSLAIAGMWINRGGTKDF
jgi:hypothetical protein